MKTITKEIDKGRQAVIYTEILKQGTNKFRVRIKSDSYEFQCFASVDYWNGNEWKNVHTKKFDNMKTPNGLAYVSGEIGQTKFKQDRDDLINIALEIVGESKGVG